MEGQIVAINLPTVLFLWLTKKDLWMRAQTRGCTVFLLISGCMLCERRGTICLTQHLHQWRGTLGGRKQEVHWFLFYTLQRSPCSQSCTALWSEMALHYIAWRWLLSKALFILFLKGEIEPFLVKWYPFTLLQPTLHLKSPAGLISLDNAAYHLLWLQQQCRKCLHARQLYCWIHLFVLSFSSWNACCSRLNK